MAAKRSVSPGPIDLMKVSPSCSSTTFSAVVSDVAYTVSFSRRARASRPSKTRTTHKTCKTRTGDEEIMRLIAEPNSVNNKKRMEVTYLQHPSKTADPTTCNLCSDSTGFVCSGQYEKSLNSPGFYIDNNEIFNPDFSRKKYEEVRLKIKKLFEYDFPFNPFESFLEEVPIHRKFNAKLPVRKQLDKLKMIRKNDRCVVCKKCVLQGRLVQCHHCTKLYHLNCLDPPIRDWDHSMRWICPAHGEFLELAYPDVFTPGRGLLTYNNITTKRSQCELPSMPVDKYFSIPDRVSNYFKSKSDDCAPTTSNGHSSLNILCDIASIELESINSIDKNNETGNIASYISYKLLEKKKSLLAKKCNATLSCLTVPYSISVQREVLTIGKSLKNRLSLQHIGNCEYISDYHATIRYDKKSGDFILKNLSRFGVIVDNVSYFGNRRQSSNNHEPKKVNSGHQQHVNKQKRTNQKDKIIRPANNDKEKSAIKFTVKKRAVGYNHMSKYHTSKYKNMKHGYQKAQCNCSKRLIQKDGYSGIAILRNESIIIIGCIKFKFIYDVGTTEILKVCTDESLAKIDGIDENKPLNESPLKCVSEQENGINMLIDTINNLNSFSINENCSLEDAGDKNSIKEQNNTNKLDLDNSAHSKLFNTKVDGVSENIARDNDDIQPLEINASETSVAEYRKQWEVINAMSSDEKSCYASDLIQEVEINESSEDGEIIEEEIVYEMNYAEADNGAPGRNNDVQDWLIEEIVIDDHRNFNDNEPGHSNDLQLTSTVEFPVPACNDEDFKSEHLYCARSLTYDDETIVISDDDDGDNYDTDNDGKD